MNYQRKYSFSGFQANNPARPLPATQLDAELDAISEAFEQTLDAFGIAKANGFQGNVVQWLASLKGEPGARGPQGEQGLRGLQGEKGDRGVQGVQGDPGHDGPKGDQGVQGAKGDAGPQGNAGPQGDRGLQGLQGAKGDAGAKGDQGPQGDQGARGLQGLPGADGVNGANGKDGAKGEKGDQGLQGPQGAGVTIVGTVASPADLPAGADPGDTYIVSTSGDGYTAGDGYAYTGGGYTNVGQIRGPQGVQGAKGDAGAKGADGAAGAKGDQGLQGAKGDTGSAGAKGDTGSAGAKGDQGIQGEKGDTGAKGDQGFQGVKGVKGDQGIQGIQGPKGDQGVQGAKGDTGPAGSLGFTPVQQGKGPGQGTNTVSLGWGNDESGAATLLASVDGVNLGVLLTDYSLAGGQTAAGAKNRKKFVNYFGAGLPGDHYCEISSQGPGPIGNAGFVRVGAGTVVKDTEGLFDTNNFWYNVPESGLYFTGLSIRPNDSAGGFEWGYGLDIAEQDGPYFKWDYRPGVTRWVGQYALVRHLNKGDQLRCIVYGYYPGTFTRVATQVYLIRPDGS